jgi:hypothetical protein
MVVLEQNLFGERDGFFADDSAVIKHLQVRGIGPFRMNRLTVFIYDIAALHSCGNLLSRYVGKAFSQEVDNGRPRARGKHDATRPHAIPQG